MTIRLDIETVQRRSRLSRAYLVKSGSKRLGMVVRCPEGWQAAREGHRLWETRSSFKAAVLYVARPHRCGVHQAIRTHLCTRVLSDSEVYLVDGLGYVFRMIETKSREAVRVRSAFAPHFDFTPTEEEEQSK